MVWDILIGIATLDIGFLAGLVFGNLHWFFAFAALSFIFFEGKKPVRAFIHVTFAAMFFAAFLPFIGWAEFTGPFLLFFYLADLAMLKFFETIPYFSKRLVWVEELTFFGCLILFNVILA